MASDHHPTVEWLREWLASRKRTCATEIRVDSRWVDLGLDSADLTELAAQFSEHLRLNVPVVAFWAHPTISAIIDFLRRPAARATTRSGSVGPQAPGEHVAVIGMACRFSGCSSLEQFWDALKANIPQVRDPCVQRWPDPNSKAQLGRGAYLDRVD